MALDILIVDDERDIRELVAGVLSDEGYDCRTAADSDAALAAVDEKRPSLVLLDVWLHGSAMDGLEVLDAIKVREPDLPVIIFSGHGNIDTAVSAVSRGAVDFIEKPVSIKEFAKNSIGSIDKTGTFFALMDTEDLGSALDEFMNPDNRSPSDDREFKRSKDKMMVLHIKCSQLFSIGKIDCTD